MKVYLVIYMGEIDYPDEVLEELELIPESKIVETVKTMIEEERICPETIEDGKYDIENIDVVTAIKILDADGWTVKEYKF